MEFHCRRSEGAKGALTQGVWKAEGSGLNGELDPIPLQEEVL